ncbi:CDP-diacylglycerol--glycerol-3-phosphate 3-phosphatidyltransferase [Treponema bryantii]|uniref:CDP-diacylglycerol--glycerol-3-phosphate 3-phosphatidyltransferase n=1 Tax=Treponema bryantii TaxID=163 RepID=A0A1H9CLH5_9SPIR|nr:CDP-diacylglycerol--glycerol-3-phosphate 3-phosphatidyltransferase [Treponema bryantii]SEQ01911.1 CDP-diacylglycerol--glycerol-3-phosphate 3-phosphatidyltransferase [Treponema bryantii]
MKLSNKFTFTRIIFAPIFFLLYFIPIWTGCGTKFSLLIAIPCLVFAEFTDYLDGHYARKHNEVSDFGKLFDPFADVVLHLTAFVCLMHSVKSGISYMPVLFFVLIMLREFSQNFLRMVAAKQGTAIAARKGGKLKTVVYIIAEFYGILLELMLRMDIVPEFWGGLKIGVYVLFGICVILSYASFIDYLIHFGKILKDI